MNISRSQPELPIPPAPISMGHGPQPVVEAAAAPEKVDTANKTPPFQVLMKALGMDEKTGLSKKYSDASLYDAHYMYDIKELSIYRGDDGKMYYQAALDREIAIPQFPNVKLQNQIVQTRVAVPDPLTEMAVDEAMARVRLNIGATESRMERALLFSEIRREVMQERYIECEPISSKESRLVRNYSLHNFRAYGVKIDGKGREIRSEIGYDHIAFTKHNESDWKEFARHAPVPPSCKYHAKVYEKQKKAEKLLLDAVQFSAKKPPSLEYQSKLAELSRFLEEEPKLSYNSLFSLIVEPLQESFFRLHQAKAQDLDESAFIELAEFEQASQALDRAKTELQKATQNEREECQQAVKKCEEALQRSFESAYSTLSFDLLQTTDARMKALQNLKDEPQLRNMLDAQSVARFEHVLQELNTEDNRAVVNAIGQLQHSFLTEADKKGLAFRQLLEEHNRKLAG